MKNFLYIFAAGALLTGCSVSGVPPENDDEFFKAAQSHRFGTAVTFVTSRSVSSIENTFKSAASRCLNVTKVTEASIAGPIPSRERTVSNYRAQVVRKGGGVTLNIMRDGTKAAFGAPKGFTRTIMADARPVSGGTQVRLAGPSANYENVYKTIAEWARGQSTRCPKFKI